MLLAVLALGLGLGLYRLGLADLDVDEAFAALIAEAPLRDFVASIQADGSPPLFYLWLWVWEKFAGSSPFWLRSLSTLMGLAALGATYWATRTMTSRAAARWAALLMVVSPLWLFRARDLRMYAMVALLSALSMGLLHRAATERRLRYWLLLGLVVTAGLYTHNFGLFIPAACVGAIAHPLYRSAWRPLSATLAVALALWLPWLPNALAQAGSGSHDWIEGFWSALPPIAAIPKSIVAFLPGGFYPVIMRPMPRAASPFLVASLALALLGLGGALHAVRASAGARQARATLAELLSFLFVPLTLAWLYSVLVRPIYLVGRYDIIALPAFCGVVGWGIAHCVSATNRRWRASIASFSLVLLLGLAVSTWVPYYRGLEAPLFHQADLAAEFLARNLRRDDLLLYTGLRRKPLEYALRRRGASPAVERSFPAELEDHPGWKSERRMLLRREELSAEALAVAKELESYVQSGRRVWLAAGSRLPWDLELMRLVSERLQIDRDESNVDLALLCLRARTLPLQP